MTIRMNRPPSFHSAAAPKPPEIPPYAIAHSGKATQARRRAAEYRAKVSALESEIAACERAFEQAFERADASSATRNRIDQLARLKHDAGLR